MTEHAEPISTPAADSTPAPDSNAAAGPSDAVVDGVFDLAREGHTDQLGQMLDAGVPLDLLNGRGDSLLIVASYAQHTDTVRELLRRGAATSVVNTMGQTALACAVFRNNEAILRVLLEADADPDLGAHPAAQIADQFGLPRMREVIESFGPVGA
ncbi:ankyrin repeat domain-containing protein [Cryobacterium frigoriphilum]|uniref:ankyrin repeat domain-containing protein n=1 Tax=Cryobacterium frigoriphilum TaxID=1259150 RepID=UPI0018E0A743|nr:ankyrin repeat domain-containing protein [Cryobacterium frigoriphilum]